MPNLQGRFPIGSGAGPGLPSYGLGATGGEGIHTLTDAELPLHLHSVTASSEPSTLQTSPAGNFPAAPGDLLYDPAFNSSLGMGCSPAGDGAPHDNQSPFLALNFCICTDGIIPSPTQAPVDVFLGEVWPLAFSMVPGGWLVCDGSRLPILQYTELFTLLGTTYGGDGVTHFGVPDLRGRLIVSTGQTPAGASYVLGQSDGTASVQLTQSTMPSHVHTLPTATAGTDGLPPSSASWLAEPPAGRGQSTPYTDPTTQAATAVTMGPATCDPAGGSQPHNNMSPFLAVNYCIATQGLFPPRPSPLPIAPAPVFSLPTGSYSGPQTLVLMAPVPDAGFLYQTNIGPAPHGWLPYTVPIPISVSQTIIAFVRLNGFEDGPKVMANYVIS